MNRYLAKVFALILLCGTAHGQNQIVPEKGPWGANTQFHESFKVGDTIPDDLKFYRATGELVAANEMFRKSHTVIISGCLTCGMFRRTYPSVEAAYRDYKDQDVDFYFVYQTLQHPGNHSYVNAFSMEERFLQLEVAKKEYATTVPWLLDTFDNNWKTYFQVRPNTELIFDNKGRIVHVQPWVSPPNLRNALEKIFGPVENPTQVADLGLPNIPPVSNGDRTGVVKSVKVSGNALPLNFTPLKSEQTHYAKLRPEIDQALHDSGKGQMYIGLHLDPIYKVHWNNSAGPVTYELSLPEGVSASPLKGEGPLADVETDKDPREFLIDIDNWKARDEPIGIDIFYVACNKEAGWCKPVKQSYEVHLKRDMLGGKAHGRTSEADALRLPDSNNRPWQKSASAELLNLDPIHVEGFKLPGRIGGYDGPSKIGETLTNSLDMKLTYIPAGEFTMGSPSGELNRYDDEPQHRVRLSRPFLMGVTEVTQGQWEAVMGSRPWEGKSAISNPSNAASYVSWDDAVAFCRKLSEQEGKTYRLPTEAEWEYACRGGSTSAYHLGDNVSELRKFGWFSENAKSAGERWAHAVGQKLPNGWGLYDTYGNVSEWCGDWYGDYPSESDIVSDPKGPGSGSNRVLRGGNWFNDSLFSRSASRYGASPGLRTHNLGFRLVLDLDKTLGADLTSLAPGTNEVLIEHDGQSRRLLVTTPKTYSRQNAYPVLFCFHGAGGKAEGQSARWSPQADKNSMIVISAEAVRSLKKWNIMDHLHAEDHDDVGFVSKVIETLIAKKIADPKAIFATGHSSGGLFSWRLAKETDYFAAVSPMSCGMIKGAHDPDEKTKPVSIFQVIGDIDKSFNGSVTPDRTMRSAKGRIEIWRTFNRCGPDPVVVKKGEEIVVYTYTSPSGLEVVLCEVKDQEHHIRRDLRDSADMMAIDFLFKHQRK